MPLLELTSIQGKKQKTNITLSLYSAHTFGVITVQKKTDVGQLLIFVFLSYPSVCCTLCLGAWLAGMVFSNGFNAAMISANDGRALGSLQQIQEAAPLRIQGIEHSPDKNLDDEHEGTNVLIFGNCNRAN